MRKNLVSERKRAGLSRKQAAAAIHRSEDVLGKWERGETSPPLFPDGIALARLYGCSVDYLCELTEERVPTGQKTITATTVAHSA